MAEKLLKARELEGAVGLFEKRVVRNLFYYNYTKFIRIDTNNTSIHCTKSILHLFNLVDSRAAKWVPGHVQKKGAQNQIRYPGDVGISKR